MNSKVGRSLLYQSPTTVTGSVEVLSDYPKKIVLPPTSVHELVKALTEVSHWKNRDESTKINFAAYTWSAVAEKMVKYFLESVKHKV